MSRGAADHWDEVFTSRRPDQVSWFQDRPATSLRLLEDVPGSVIDVGGGASTLVDELLAAGRSDLTVLDVSAEALALTRGRLGSGSRVALVIADLLAWSPPRQYDAWHDRAVFHFLTTDDEQTRYVDVACRAVRVGGVAVLGVFAEDGPDQCSGLPTARHSADDLARIFTPGFVLEHDERERHVTPSGAGQSFTWVRLRRVADAD